MLQLHAAASLVRRQTSFETWFPTVRSAGAGARNGTMKLARSPCATLSGAGVVSGQPVERQALGSDNTSTNGQNPDAAPN